MASTQEARFLESREARRSRPRPQQRNENQKLLHTFWTSLRHDLHQWESRLDTLEVPRTACQRTKITESLDELLQDLYKLRKECLSSSTDDVPELPPADVRLLHQEFTRLATKLESLRQELVPPTKFTFKKYREAMKERQQQQEHADDSSSAMEAATKAEDAPATNDLSCPLNLSGNVLQDFCDATLTLDSTGSLTVQNGEGTSVRESENDSLSSSLLLRNLTRCQVNIDGTYKALHIHNVNDSIVRVLHPVEGAIHVTASVGMNLYATCHQLRLHESKNLKIHCRVESGPILEDCTDIVFYADVCRQVYDAKDFNWLRNGVPSPNFRVVDNDASGSTSQKVGVALSSTPVSSNAVRDSSARKAANDATLSDDEDEL